MRPPIKFTSSIFMVACAICMVLFSVKAYALIDPDTVNDRLRAKLQENIDDPWPGIGNANNAAGIFSYALACLHLNQNVDQANQLLLNFYTNNPIPPNGGGRDTWEGYFWQHIVWRLFHDPAAGGRLTTPVRDLIEDNMWVWLDTRSKITEAEQSEWLIYDSENHDAMTKGSHLMCLLALKKSPRYGPAAVLKDGGTIAEHLGAWTAFYMRYFRARAQEGINVEIACQQYARYTVGAYFNIMDFSDSADLRALTKNFIDLYWADTASDWLSSGVRGGGQTRCYREGSYMRTGTSYAFHGPLWAKGWHDNESTIRTYQMILAVSPYRIPDIITAGATDPARPNYLYTSRRFGRGGGWDSNTNYPVVFDNGNSSIRRETYVTPDYTMGTFALDMNKDYIALFDQNRVMGVMFASDPNERVMVFGKGGSDPTKSFADINGVTRENCMVVQRDKNASSGGNATQLYVSPQAWANRIEANGWLFTQLDDAYCAIKPAAGGYTSETAGAGVNLTLGDLWAPVVIQTGQAGDYADFADFRASVEGNTFTYVSETMNYTSEAGDTFTFFANTKTTPKVNGATVDLNPDKTYDSPYLSMTHGESIATFSYSGYPDLTLDFGYDPGISSLVPADDATGVAVDTDLVITFNEPIRAGAGAITIRKSSDDSTVASFDINDSPQVEISGSQITINPSLTLATNTQYNVIIDPTAIEDLAGNPFAGLAGNNGWNFTTASPYTISVMNIGSKVVAGSLGNSSTSLSFNAGDGADMLVVAISTERSAGTYAVRYAGTPLLEAVDATQAGIWYLDLQDSTYAGGAADLVVDFSGITTVNGIGIGAVSITAGGQPIDLHSTAINPFDAPDRVMLATTRDGTFQVASFNANGSGSPSLGGNISQIYANGNIGSAQGAAGYKTDASGTDHTYLWATNEPRKAVAAAFMVNTFSTWVDAYDLGSLSGFGDDGDQDGIPNAIEAWLGTHPGESNPGIENFAADASVTNFTHPVAENPPADLVGVYQWSANLADWYICDGIDGPATGQTVNANSSVAGGTATVTVTPNEPMPALFLRLTVIQNP